MKPRLACRVGNWSGDEHASLPLYKYLSDALSAYAAKQDVTFYLAPGRFEGPVDVHIPGLKLVGSGQKRTIISADKHADSQRSDGSSYGVAGSATLMLHAPDFDACDLTIENSFDYPSQNAVVENAQAVALRTLGNADNTVLRRVRIAGWQDTLYLDAGCHLLEACQILGHVDFIFGDSTAWFEDCSIVSRPRPDKNPSGYICAPSTHPGRPYGFVFKNCNLIPENEHVAAASVRLARPWHPGADPARNGSAVFIDCFMDKHIGPEGYEKLSARDEQNQRIWFQVGPQSRFFELGSHGPGAEASPQRPWLPADLRSWYSRERVLGR